MRRLQDEVNRRFQSAAAPRSGGFPVINVYAHQDGIVIIAELPDVRQEDLEITAHRDTVTLRGESREQPQGAASIAGLLITTEAMVAEKPKETAARAMPGGGMGDMDF